MAPDRHKAADRGRNGVTMAHTVHMSKSRDGGILFGAIFGAGLSPLFVAMPVMAITGGAPVWLIVLAVLFAVVALAWTGWMIRKALQWTP